MIDSGRASDFTLFDFRVSNLTHMAKPKEPKQPPTLCANCYIPMIKESFAYRCPRCGLERVIPKIQC
jgi:Zn finger protein HypA/HybF involved in hydrogenase expression